MLLPTIKEKILTALQMGSGLTDRELTDLLFAETVGQQKVNQAARSLEQQHTLVRRERADGKIGNFLVEGQPLSDFEGDKKVKQSNKATEKLGMSEDEVKQKLKEWLESDGWEVRVKWGHARGIDIDATRGEERWIIEAKGSGSRTEMRNNYFLGVLGETLQRMNEESASFSVAFPDLQKFRRLWAELPTVVKVKLKMTALFVGVDGIDHVVEDL